MQFFACIVIALAAFVDSTNAAPATFNQLDVWAPPIKRPNSSTTWFRGAFEVVTWDTSGEPEQVTNPKGTVYLRKDNRTDVDRPLAKDFPLRDGNVTVTVPSDIAVGFYSIILFGDSGNESDPFYITDQTS